MTEYPRVAVLMIGNMRSFNITSKNLELFLLEPFKCDLYITTYDKRFNFKLESGVREEFMGEDIIKSTYGKYLKHLVIVNQDAFIEKYVSIPGKGYMFENILDRFYTMQKLTCMAYEIFRGECIRNMRNYDYIVKLRPDIMLKDRFPLNTTITTNQIMIPNNDSGGSFNDQLAYGKPRVMEKYFLYYKVFGDIDRLDNGKACDVSIVEAGLYTCLCTNKFEILRVPIHYLIIRDIKPQKVMYFGKGQYYIKKY